MYTRDRSITITESLQHYTSLGGCLSKRYSEEAVSAYFKARVGVSTAPSWAPKGPHNGISQEAHATATIAAACVLGVCAETAAAHATATTSAAPVRGGKHLLHTPLSS